MRKYFFRFLTIFIFIVIFFAGIGFGLFRYYERELPPLAELQRFDMKVGSEVYDNKDNLIHTFSVEKRKLTKLDELPYYLTDGLIAVEDNNFYQHWGLDQKGLLRALLIDMMQGSFAQGASTITQQLARNMFLSLDKQIPRKIKELLLAVQIEKNFSKDEILEFYLNKAPFGPGLYGVEVASQRYFGKDAKDVNIAEAALLIGMPQLPSSRYPYRYYERALSRRNLVLQRMLKRGVINQQEYIQAVNSEIELVGQDDDSSANDYFVEHIRKYLEKKYGTTALFTEGLKIYTTLDLELQVYADSVLNETLRKFENKNNYEVKYADFPADTTDIKTDYVQGGVFSIEPETGYVRVMIGGRNFEHSKLNRMTQSNRSPGSSFKPIIYTTAIQNGYTPATVIQDEPTYFIEADTLLWNPQNYSNNHFGYTRLRQGLKKSRNIFSAKMTYDLGPRKIADNARRFGISTPVPPVYSLAVGSLEVRPYELISAYTTFPNGGERTQPIFIRRVEDSRGNILEAAEVEKIRVIDEKTAYLMSNLLQSVVDDGGTGVGIRWRGYKWTAAGKTGTTDDFRDAWFIGFNKKLVTGIWVGFDDNSKLGSGQSGATAALPAWPYIMKKAIELDSPLAANGRPIIDGSEYNFIKPEGIITERISQNTGLLPKYSYEETLDEIFINGTQPTPLSDSLSYNFYPTAYRVNEQDSLVIDLGGRPYQWSERPKVYRTKIDFTKRDSLELYPRLEIPRDIDSLYYLLDGVWHKQPENVHALEIELSEQNLAYKFQPAIWQQSQIEAVDCFVDTLSYSWPDSILWRKRPQPQRLDLRGAKIMKDHRYVERPDSLLWWGWQPDSLQVPAADDLDILIDSLWQESQTEQDSEDNQ
ncbi:MAG: PBP1A family penicillin-binding protein [Candidatus Cloacimonadales bacterium]